MDHSTAEVGGLDAPANISTSEVLPIGGAIDGSIGNVGDHDWAQVTLTAGQSYIFTLAATGPTPLDDPYLSIHNSSGNLLTWDDDSGAAHDALLRFTPTNSGTYYLDASNWNDEATGGYRLTAQAVAAQNPLNSISGNLQLASPAIKIYFATTGEHFDAGVATRSWTQAEKTAAFAAAQTWANVTNLTFTEVFSSGAATMVLMLDSGLVDAAGRMTFPPGSPNVGTFDPSGPWWTTNGALAPGGKGFQVIIHEIGHALGLGHPHDTGAGTEVLEGVTDEFDSYGVTLLNQGVYTVMSYNDGWYQRRFGPDTYTSGSESTPMAMDVAAVQQRYGVHAFNAGDNVYDMASVLNQGFQSIWDTGGVDWIIQSAAGHVVIDLRPATLQVGSSGFGGYISSGGTTNRGGYTIANSVVIENARGGAGDDTIYGNEANNILDGGAGNNAIDAGGGDDLIISWGGSDAIDGGAGTNTVDYSGRSFSVGVNLDGGSVTNIQIAIGTAYDDRISGGVADNTIHGGAGADILSGNAGNDLLYGEDGNDDLDGGAGGDTMFGGAGADIMKPGDGDDYVDGGAGLNTLSYFNGGTALAGVIVDLRLIGPQNTVGAGIDTLIGFINLQGTTTTDTLIGTDQANVIFGFGGQDQIYGLGGDDNLSGGMYMYGGAGNDTYQVVATLFSPEPIIFEGGSNPDLMAGAGDIDTIISNGLFYWDYYSVAEYIRVDYSGSVSGTPETEQLVGGKDVALKHFTGGDRTDLIVTYGHDSIVDAGRGTDAISFDLYDLDQSYRGHNTVIMKPGSGTDYVYQFQSGIDKIDLSAFHFGITGNDVLAQAVNVDNAGAANDYCYFYLTNAGNVNNFIVFMGLLSSQLHGSDFIL